MVLRVPFSCLGESELVWTSGAVAEMKVKLCPRFEVDLTASTRLAALARNVFLHETKLCKAAPRFQLSVKHVCL